MDVSCHSFLRMAHLAEPLMTAGGCLLTVTFYGSERVVAHYNLMGPVKAALESAVRYTAAELGAKGIRANAISPGLSAPEPPAGSPTSTNYWPPRQLLYPNTSWWTSMMSALWLRSWSATAHAKSQVRSFPWMAGSTRSHDSEPFGH